MTRILIIDDDSAIHLITAAALQHSGGFEVSFARTGRQGIHAARSAPPDLILLDLMLPDLNGDEVLVELRRHPELQAVPVIFVTAKEDLFAVDPDRSGAQGVISKPFEPEQLAARVREVLRLPDEPDGEAAEPERGSQGLPAGGSVERLRTGFVSRGRKEVQRLERTLDGRFDIDASRRLAHLWIGRGGTLGYPAVSEAARRFETLLSLPTALDPVAIGKALATVEAAFTAAEVELQVEVAETIEDNRCRHTASRGRVPEVIRDALAGRTVWLVGFEPADAADLEDALAGTGAGPFLRAQRPGEIETGSPDADFVILDIDAPATDARRRFGNVLAESGTGVLLIGSAPMLLQGDPSALTELVLRPWSDQELLLRCYQLVSEADARDRRAGDTVPGPSADASGRERRVVIADDDPAITTLVEATLGSIGVSCAVATGGDDALALVRELHPAAAILDVNMPQRDGFEVLAELRRDPATADLPVIMLTALRQEAEIVRGFRLGAHDYVVKPFNPMELSVRLERLLRGGARDRFEATA